MPTDQPDIPDDYAALVEAMTDTNSGAIVRPRSRLARILDARTDSVRPTPPPRQTAAASSATTTSASGPKRPTA